MTEYVGLSIREDGFDRDVSVRKSLTSAGLFAWIALGFVLIYEVAWAAALLVARGGSRTDRKEKASGIGSQQSDEEGPRQRPEQPRESQSRRQYPLSKERCKGLASFVPIVIVWGIATVYSVFYQFDMIFKYLNDRWYQLLPVQAAFTLSDVCVLIWVVGRTKYNVWLDRTIWGKACILVKFAHMIFNIVLESNFWEIRNLLFLAEDLTSLYLAQWIFGCSVKTIDKRAWIILTVAVLLGSNLISSLNLARLT
ncbi:hypothetical protein ACHAWF_004803 [Thalassiosira exigua]